MKEVLTIQVTTHEVEAVANSEREARMVFFGGYAACPSFHGEILSGGVDTQLREGAIVTLSARYLLSGCDATGAPCRIFIENNGILAPAAPDTPVTTTPRIITDSSALRFLETAALTGTVVPAGETQVTIHIFV